MLTDVEIISQAINSIRLDIIKSQESKKLRASGKSASELQVNINETFGQIVDPKGSFYEQEFGRKAGTYPPFKAIYDWLAYRKYGFNWKDEKERRSMTFAIMHKNKMKGSFTFIHGPTNVIQDVVTPERITAIAQAFAGKYASSVASDIVKDLN